MKKVLFLCCLAGLLCGCASRSRDPYYVLESKLNERDSIRAAEYEKMKTPEYRESVRSWQNGQAINNAGKARNGVYAQ